MVCFGLAVEYVFLCVGDLVIIKLNGVFATVAPLYNGGFVCELDKRKKCLFKTHRPNNLLCRLVVGKNVALLRHH